MKKYLKLICHFFHVYGEEEYNISRETGIPQYTLYREDQQVWIKKCKHCGKTMALRTDLLGIGYWSEPNMEVPRHAKSR